MNKKKYTCLILTREHDEFEEKLKRSDLSDLNIIIGRDEKIIQETLPEVDILFGNPPLIKKYITQAPRVKWVQSTFAGIDALVAPNLPNNYQLTNVKDTYGKPMSEYVFAYILGLKRKVFENKKWQSEHNWNQFGYDVIEQETIGIVGTGSIGKEIARIAKAFGMKTRGMNTKGDSVDCFDEVYANDDQANFFKNLDYVVSVLPNTEKTKHFFNTKTFSLMDSSSWFISIGRGQNVCEVDLISALKKNEIKGAVLDVFETEPLDKKSELWDLENVYITPHVSGYVTTDIAFDIFAKNYEKFCKNKTLDYLVDFKRGY